MRVKLNIVLVGLSLVLPIQAIPAAESPAVSEEGATTQTQPTESIVPQDSRYGAIAYSASTERYGVATGYGSSREAEDAALRWCKAGDCRVVVAFQDGCGALMKAGNGAIVWASGASLIEAKRTASNECTRRWGGCKFVCSMCSRGDVP